MIKNVLFIIPSFYSGGAQHSLAKLTIALGERYNIYICTFNDDYPTFYEYAGQKLSLDINGGTHIIDKASKFFQRISSLKQIKSKYSIDVSISFLEGADYINVLSKQKEKIILSIRGSKLHDGNIKGFIGKLRLNVLIPFLYGKADAIVSVNKGIIHELDTFFKLENTKKVVIPNFYNKEKLLALAQEPLPDSLSFITNNPFIISSSRLAREKHIDFIIRTFALVHKNGFEGRLVIVGDGPERLKLEEECKRNELVYCTAENPNDKAKVVFTGSDKNPHKYVAKALSFIMASESEGFPNALAESLILGVPVMSGDCPWGPKEILSENFTSIETIKEPLVCDLGLLLPPVSGNNDQVAVWSEHMFRYLTKIRQTPIHVDHFASFAEKYKKENIVSKWIDIIG